MKKKLDVRGEIPQWAKNSRLIDILTCLPPIDISNWNLFFFCYIFSIDDFFSQMNYFNCWIEFFFLEMGLDICVARVMRTIWVRDGIFLSVSFSKMLIDILTCQSFLNGQHFKFWFTVCNAYLFSQAILPLFYGTQDGKNVETKTADWYILCTRRMWCVMLEPDSWISVSQKNLVIIIMWSLASIRLSPVI